jgi:eukaryotic-like serine/threonine-protein kinase
MVPVPEAGRDAAGSVSFARLEVPEEIGPYKILRLIGAGGMGIVYLAQQERPTRTVALKVIHASMLSQRMLGRFEQEAEVLARLHHPGIAQIYQIGTYVTPQGDLPYIAMEFVEGERLDHYLARLRPDLRTRLELAARIADAVEHAHQKGVIHRDLKPGNILVTADGQPKVLDFGVARLTDDDTRTTTLRTDVGALLGTLTYMSPEQASGDSASVDTRADVYSLGVVLYELLTGKLPYYLDRNALPEAVRVIREEEPTKLSTHDRTLRGDVETIVRKALEKDRERRYPSAQALADDIRRHLADEPIHARPPSAWYQLSKFARRNQMLVSGVAAVLLTSLIGAGVATHLFLREREANLRERAARAQAESQEKRASAAAGFLLSIFEGIDPAVARGADTTLLRNILAKAQARMSTELADQPEVEAQLRATLGSAYIELTLFAEAKVELERALELRLGLYGPDDRRVLALEAELARLAKRSGELARAEAEQRATLERQTEVLGATDSATLQTKSSLGDSLMRQGRYMESESVLREVLEEQERQFGDESEDVLATRMALSQVLSFESKAQEAHDLIESVFLARSTKKGDDDPDTIIALATLGSALRDLGHLKEAEEAQRDALERAQRVFGEDNQQTLSMMNNLSLTLREANRLDEAEVLLRDVLARRRRVFGDEHLETLNTLNNLASLLWKAGKLDEAEPMILEIVETSRRVLGEDNRETLRAYQSAALLLGRQHKMAEAAKLYEVVARHERENLRGDDPDLALTLYNWAACLQNAGDNAGAEPVLRELLTLVDEYGMQSELFVPAARNALAKVLEERGAHEEADELFQAALEDRRSRYSGAHPEIAYSLSDYGEILLDRGQPADALPLIEELVEMQEKLAPREKWVIPSARQLLGQCLTALGRYAEAEPPLVSACEALEKQPDALPSAAREARQGILALYAAWDAAEPGQGIAARAERWQTKFPAE